MITRVSSSRLPEASAWNSALCSESAGRMQAPALAARSMKKSPAQTRHSLLASATVAPRSTAASAGFKPAAPDTAAISQSAGRSAASTMALSPAPLAMPVPASAARSSSSLDCISDGHEARVEFLGQLDHAFDVAVGGQRLHLVPLGRGSQQIHGAVADRTGRTKDGDAAQTGRGGLVISQGNSAHQITKP